MYKKTIILATAILTVTVITSMMAGKAFALLSTTPSQTDRQTAGNGGSGGSGGAGGEGGFGGTNSYSPYSSANGGSSNGGGGGSANGGNICDNVKGHTDKGEVCGSS